MKLAIGTAQFGMVYGISNKYGQTPQREVANILATAQKSGIELLDTATGYGQSEKILGKALLKSHTFKIVTKTPHLKSPVIGISEVKYVKTAFEKSLCNLCQDTIYGLLVHNADDLLVKGGTLLFDELRRLKNEGFIQKIGVSVYHGKQLDNILERYEIDIAQIPLSIFDQRLLRGGYLTQLKSLGVEVHARSIFLQGLLMMPIAEIPPFFSPLMPLLQRYHRVMDDHNAPLQTGALNFVKQIDEIDYFIVGVCTKQQLIENIKIHNLSLPLKIDCRTFACENDYLLNPCNWTLT